MNNSIISKENVWTLSVVLIALAAVAVVLIFTGCSSENYKVDYAGAKELYKGAKDSYKAGATVTLYFDLIATDTDYSFYLDGERLNTGYDEKKGIVITFVMPSHDVTLECNTVNSMEPYPVAEEVMLIDYYNERKATVQGDGHYEIVLTSAENEDEVYLDEYVKEDEGDEICTSYLVPYEVVDRCYEVIDDNDLRGWEELESPVSVDGAKVVVKFLDGDSYVRVTTDEMPTDGDKVLDEIYRIMTEYMRDEYLITPQ